MHRSVRCIVSFTSQSPRILLIIKDKELTVISRWARFTMIRPLIGRVQRKTDWPSNHPTSIQVSIYRVPNAASTVLDVLDAALRGLGLTRFNADSCLTASSLSCIVASTFSAIEINTRIERTASGVWSASGLVRMIHGESIRMMRPG
jgi:hypothetical protein